MRALRLVVILLVCASPLAAQTSAQHGIQNGDLDKSCDPCTDFAQYANGTWHAQNPIPPYMDRWSRRWQAGEEAKDQLKVILDEVSSRTDWAKGSVEQLIGDYYSSCMDEPRINKLGLSPAEPMLKQIREMKSAGDLQLMIRSLHEQAIFVPFGLASQPDVHNPTETIANVFASGLGLPDRDYYLKPEDRFKEAREKYHEHVANMFKLAGYDENSAKAAADTVFHLEEKLAENSLDNVALRDPVNTDHKMTYAAFTKLAPAMDWDAYFASAKISRADLNVSEPKFMTEVERQLRETSLAEWKTYLTWQLLNAKADALSEPFVNENFEFQGKYLSGATEIKPRWKRCAESTDQLLGEALGKKYVEKYFPPKAKTRAQEMVGNIVAAMHDTIEGLTWMGPETKKKALEKLAALNTKIGYPDKWKDYSSIAMSRKSFWSNQEAAMRWNVIDDDWNLIGKPTDRGRWGMTPPTSNAYYTPLLNEIVFPAAILQPPAFDVILVHSFSRFFRDRSGHRTRDQPWI